VPMSEQDYRCDRAHDKTGDRGQRYEVRATERATGKQIVIGWTNRADGGSIAEGSRLWPRLRDVVVIDRGEQR